VSAKDGRLHLRVTPGATVNRVLSTAEGELQARIAAPAREGKANQELIGFLARSLGVALSRVTMVRGERSRHKVMEIAGLTREEALARLGLD
jgi:uncharacterized protein